MNYKELKNKQEKNLNKFSKKFIIWAFDEKQFLKGKEKLKIKSSRELISIGGRWLY